ncbi:hypothetical protein CYMTET_55996 [Cymbomonas tetramitiformis]|uniref:Uncharacterized protein n=1 Tax=Cymbomonas tetramitiformis TaxID=36881 RepID=A0AAE0BBT6_9CHLO|nr:hypothetical protein CYMTET_55996 [Cymbomonas tetramitiformis]
MTTRKRPTPVGLAEHFNNDMITKVVDAVAACGTAPGAAPNQMQPGVVVHAPPGAFHPAVANQQPQAVADASCGGVATYAQFALRLRFRNSRQWRTDASCGRVTAHAPPGAVRTAFTIQQPQVVADVQDNPIAAIGVWVKFLSECPWLGSGGQEESEEEDDPCKVAAIPGNTTSQEYSQ